MKQQVDKGRVEKEFTIGDSVFVKLKPYMQQSVEFRQNNKLSPLYFRPYIVKNKIKAVAYRLKLPSGSAIHLFFHVSQLKRRFPPSR